MAFCSAHGHPFHHPGGCSIWAVVVAWYRSCWRSAAANRDRVTYVVVPGDEEEVLKYFGVRARGEERAEGTAGRGTYARLSPP
jgi:hypothetical protein